MRLQERFRTGIKTMVEQAISTVEGEAPAEAKEPATPCPVFDANAALYQNLGLLKVAEMAARKHGDLVLLHLRNGKTSYLVTGQQSVWCWHEQTAKFPAEFGNLTSSTGAMNLLWGEGTALKSDVASLLRPKLAALEPDLGRWFDQTLEAATEALVEEASHAASDLRQLCRLWSVRAVCHTLFGTALSDAEMAAGLMLVEKFYAVATSASGSEPEVHEHLRQTRAFLDRVLSANMAAAKSGDRTVLASLLEVMPADIGPEARLDCLRPILLGMVDEKLSIEGMNLLWALIHLAQDPDLVEAIAKETLGPVACGMSTLNISPLALSVAKETQRLYPQLPFIHRTISQDVQFGGRTIPAQAAVLFAPYLIHRDERCWTEPARFDSRRFLGVDTIPFPFSTTLQAREQADFIQRHVALAVDSLCLAHRFVLVPESLPGNLRPVLRSILEPRGYVDVCWSPRLARGDETAPILSSQLQSEEKIAW
ncbi:cytochrome P450 [Sinorhizobium meliloti]|uniref:cytochrome P450 n=1 Tax=Rhizobium meliloti TaxID=382 RepID=UPI000418CD23|nr:cytochrome P450 [Sinorhizobium meliloti]